MQSPQDGPTAARWLVGARPSPPGVCEMRAPRLPAACTGRSAVPCHGRTSPPTAPRPVPRPALALRPGLGPSQAGGARGARAGRGRGAGTVPHAGLVPTGCCRHSLQGGTTCQAPSWPWEGPERAREQVQLGEPCRLLPAPREVGVRWSAAPGPPSTLQGSCQAASRALLLGHMLIQTSLRQSRSRCGLAR